MGPRIKPRSKHKFSLEMIDVQKNDSFGSMLEEQFAIVKKGMDDGVYKTAKDISEAKINDTIEKLVKERFGLSIKLIISRVGNGSIIIMPVSDHHIFIHDLLKNSDVVRNHNKLAKIQNENTGMINLSTAKVGGMFSKYTHNLYLDLSNLFNYYKLTPGQVTAIMLHELGHAFTYYEYSNRLESTNQVLQTVFEELTSKKANKNITYVYKELAKYDIKEKDIDAIVNSQNEIIMGTRLFMVAVGIYKSQLSIGKYDETASEQSADQFAARFGYGGELGIALGKIYGDNTPEHNSAIRANINIAVTLLIGFWLLILAVTVLTLSAFGVFVSVYFSAFVIIMFMFSGTANRDMTYDNVIDRYKRIRQELINQLKDIDLLPKDTRTIIESIQSVDEIIKDAKPYRHIFQILSDLLVPSNAAAKSDIEMQQLLENLANNDLFLKSAELNLIAARK